MVTSMYMTSVVLILSSRATTGFHIHSGTRKPAPSLPQTFNVRLHAEKSKSAKRFKKKLAEAPDSSSSEDDTSSQEIDPNAETAAAAAAEASDTINNSPLVGGWSYDSPAPAPPLSAEGSYEVLHVKAVGLDGNGLVLDCSIQTCGFFGRFTKRERPGVQITFEEVFQGTEGGYASALRLERNDGTIAAAEAQRAVLAMARKVNRVEATASLARMLPSAEGDINAGVLPPNLFINNCPNTIKTRYAFYNAAVDALEAALRDKAMSSKRYQMDVLTPELNPYMDAFRVGTLLEMVRELATRLACSGLRVRVCVQGPMGRGIFVGMPLSLNGVRALLERMDWQQGPGEMYEGIVPNYVRFGAIGASECDKEAPKLPPDDVYILIAPQNVVGFSILPFLEEMVEAAKGRPVLIINPNLEDVASSEGTMSVRGRSKRLEFASSFQTIYSHKTLYPAPNVAYPIVGAVVKAAPREPYVVFERQEESAGDSTDSANVRWGEKIEDDDDKYDASLELVNAAGFKLRERHVPRASYDDEPTDNTALAVLRKAGAKW